MPFFFCDIVARRSLPRAGRGPPFLSDCSDVPSFGVVELLGVAGERSRAALEFPRDDFPMFND